MNTKEAKLSIEGINKIDLTFGGVIRLHSIGGDSNFKKLGWDGWEEDVLDLLKMPEDEIPEGFSVELEATEDHRHFLLTKDESSWDFVEGIPPTDDNDPGGWGTVYQWSETTFRATYFHFLSWYYWVKVRQLQREKDLSDEVCKEMHDKCKAELNKIWQAFKEK